MIKKMPLDWLLEANSRLQLEDEIDVVLGQLGSLAVPRELERVGRDLLCLVFKVGDQHVNGITGNDLRAHRLHEVAHRRPSECLTLCHVVSSACFLYRDWNRSI